MKALQLFVAWLVFSSLFSCRTAPELPGTSETVKGSQITLGGVLAEKLNGFVPSNSKGGVDQPVVAEGILEFQKKISILQEAGSMNLSEHLLEEWKLLQRKIALNFEKLPGKDLQKWTALNDSLLKLSGQVCFADELEKIFYNTGSLDVLTEKTVKSVCYTRRYDRIYLNIYGNSTFDFEHTTGGLVRLVQDTDFPYSGSVRVKLEMQDTRYLDLYIRIPGWAEYSSVTVHGVRYPVHPGQYTEVAKKWNNGDEIEIEFSLVPLVLRNEQQQFAFSYGPLLLSYPAEGSLAVSRQSENPAQDLTLVSPTGKMTTFTYSGIPGHTLVLQPFYAENDSSQSVRTAWLP